MYRHYLTPPSNGFGNSNFQSAGDRQNELFANAHNTSSSSKANLPFSSTFYGGSKRAHNTTYTNNRVDFSPYSANRNESSKAAAGESYSYASGTSRLSEKGQQQQQPQNSNTSPLISMSQRKQQQEDCFADFVNESAFSQPLTSCKKQLNFNNCSNSNSNNSAEWQQQQQQQQQSRQNQVYDLLSRFREASNSRLAENTSAKTEGRLYVSAQKNTLNNQGANNISTAATSQSALAQQMESAFKQLQSKEQRNLQLTPSRSGAPPLASSSASQSATPSKQQIQVQIREPLRAMNSYSNYQQQNCAEETNTSSKRNHYSPLNNKNNSNSNNNLCYQGSQQQFQQQQTSTSHSRNCSPLSSLLKPLSICFNTASHNSRSLTPVNNNNNNHSSNATNVTNPNNMMNSSRNNNNNNNSTTKQQSSSSSFSQQRPSVHQQNYLRNYLMPKQSQQPNPNYSKLQQCLTPPSQKKQAENYGTLTQESSFSNIQNPHNSSFRGRPSEEYASPNIHRTPSKTPVAAIPCNNNFFEAWNNNNNSSAGQKSQQMMMKPCFNPQSHMNSNYSNNDNNHNFSGNFANLANTNNNNNNNKSRSASPLVKNDCSKNNIFNFVNDKDQSHFSCHNYDYSTIMNNQTNNNNINNTNNTPSAMTSTTTGGIIADNFTAFIMNHTNNNILSSHNNLSREGSPFQTPLKSACSSILQPTQYGVASSEKQSKSHVQQTNNLLFQSAAADSPRFNDQMMMDVQIKNSRNNTTTLNVVNNNNTNNIVLAKANSYNNSNSANQGIHTCQDAIKIMTHSGKDMYPPPNNEECIMNQLPISLHAQHSPIMNTLIDAQHTQPAIDMSSHHMNNQQQQLATNHTNPINYPSSGDILPNSDVLSNYRQKQIVYEEAIDQADQGVKNVFKKFDVLLKTRLEALAQSKTKSNNTNNNINYHNNNTNSSNSLNNSTNHSNNGRVLLPMKPINPFNLPVSSYEPVFVTHEQKQQQQQQQPLSGINVPSAISTGINQFTIPAGKLSQAAVVVVTPTAAGGNNNNIPERSALNYQPQQQQVIVKQQPQQQQHQQPLMTTTLVKNNINTMNNPTPPPPPSNSSKNEPLPIEMTKQLEKFSLGKVLGYGSYAVVRVVEDITTNHKYALKTYEKKKLADPQKRKNVAREVKILSKLKNPNIVRLYDVIETNSQLHLLMEYPTATALSVHIRSQINRRLTEEEAKVTFIQLVQAVMYCHRKSVVHRDIKLENVLYEPSTATVKLIDFGFAIALAPGAKLNIFCGTPSYMAPEIVNKKEYTFPVDTWALGVLLYKALNGVFPFRGADDKELFRKINACKLEFQPFVSQQARNLLGKILRVNPGDRLTPEQVTNNYKTAQQQGSYFQFVFKQILQDEWLVSKPPAAAGPLPFGTTSSTQSSSGVQVSAPANAVAGAVPLQ